MTRAAEFSIETRCDGDRHVVSLTGEINLRSSPALHASLLEIIKGSPNRIILDLSGVSYMDSSGIGTLVEIKRRVDRNKGSLILAALQPRVRGLFQITKLERFFTIAADVAEAEEA